MRGQPSPPTRPEAGTGERCGDHLRDRALAVAIVFFLTGAFAAFAQDAANGQHLAQRWCTECHAIETVRTRVNRAPPFAAIAAKPDISADMIASFLRLPHATMPNFPLSRKDAQDLAAFIMEMKK